MKLLALLFAAVLPLAGLGQDRLEFFTINIASLISPEKLATLGKRGTNPRIQKAVAYLELGRREGLPVATIASNAVSLSRYTNALLAQLTREALVRNHSNASALGVFNPAGLEDMKHGRSPTIRAGPYTGDELSVDHIVPVSVAAELDNIVANLQLLPMKLNAKKGDKVGERQRDLARKFQTAGLLTPTRLEEILRH